tara:strand:- start:75 stop:380 length:306 start_codon:yes stop_codon:yes gene_type:complete
MDKKAQRIEDKQLAGLQKAIASQEVKTDERQSIKIAPSKARVLNMTYPILLENHAMIIAKASSLSATQRQYVINRIAFLLKKNKITQEEIDASIAFINNLK